MYFSVIKQQKTVKVIYLLKKGLCSANAFSKVSDVLFFFVIETKLITKQFKKSDFLCKF